MGKYLFILVSLVLVVSLVMAAWFFNRIADWSSTPLDPQAKEISLDIQKGWNINQASEHLARAGVIDRPSWFRFVARLGGKDAEIKAGEFQVSAAMTPKQVLDTLVAGKVVLHRLTVPEGFNLQDIAWAVDSKGWCDEKQFLALVKDPKTARSVGVSAPTLEGYLFPDTYFLPKDASCKKIIGLMRGRFDKVYGSEFQKRAEELSLDRGQVVTLASIIEKETGDESEYKLISGVFHNRLKKGMRLQSDPTVIYGIERFDGNLTRKHLQTPTPYNTYTNKGLPAGPICSPGKKALEAALYPADTGYLYFVSKKDGTHHFSRSLAEHNRAVRKYQLSR